MDFKEYQEKVEDTWISNDKDLFRIVLGICGEAGEIAEKYKKAFRGDYIGKEDILKGAIEKEMGDVLYYIAKLANFNDIDLEDVLRKNIEKLSKRKAKNKLRGYGDDREDRGD